MSGPVLCGHCARASRQHSPDTARRNGCISYLLVVATRPLERDGAARVRRHDELGELCVKAAEHVWVGRALDWADVGD